MRDIERHVAGRRTHRMVGVESAEHDDALGANVEILKVASSAVCKPQLLAFILIGNHGLPESASTMDTRRPSARRRRHRAHLRCPHL